MTSFLSAPRGEPAADAEGERGRFTLASPRSSPGRPVSAPGATDGASACRGCSIGTGTARQAGRVWKPWRQHLGVDDAALRTCSGASACRPRDPEVVDRLLEAQSRRRRPRRGARRLGHPPVSRPRQRRRAARRAGVRCARAAAVARRRRASGCRRPARRRQARLAYRSRIIGAVHLEDEAGHLLDLVRCSTTAALAGGVEWDRDVATRVVAFAAEHVQAGTSRTPPVPRRPHRSRSRRAGRFHRADVVPVRPSAVASSRGRPRGGSRTARSTSRTRSTSTAPVARTSPSPSASPTMCRTDVQAQVPASLPRSPGVELRVPRPGRPRSQDGAHADALAAEAQWAGSGRLLVDETGGPGAPVRRGAERPRVPVRGAAAAVSAQRPSTSSIREPAPRLHAGDHGPHHVRWRPDRVTAIPSYFALPGRDPPDPRAGKGVRGSTRDATRQARLPTRRILSQDHLSTRSSRARPGATRAFACSTRTGSRTTSTSISWS